MGDNHRMFLLNRKYAANCSVGSAKPTVDLTYSTGDISAASDVRQMAVVPPSSSSAGISGGFI